MTEEMKEHNRSPHISVKEWNECWLKRIKYKLSREAKIFLFGWFLGIVLMYCLLN